MNYNHFGATKHLPKGLGHLVKGGLYRACDPPFDPVQALYRVSDNYYWVDKYNCFEIPKNEAILNFPGAKIK